jgi:hypothetical protein
MEAFKRPAAEISRCLRGGRLEEARERAAEIVRRQAPEALRQWLPELGRLFARDRPFAPPPELRLAPLAELLWANKEAALNDMYVVGCFMGFCHKSGLYDRFRPLVRSWIASDSTPDFTFSERGDFDHFPELSRRQKRDFANAKYRRWKDFESQDFFRAVDGFSKFATVSSPITDFLFEHRAAKNLSFSQWMRDLRSAETWKHILGDANVIRRLEKRSQSPPPHYPRLPELTNLVDVERARSLFARLDLSKGLLLCTIHHAHLGLARECATQFMPEHRILARGSGENMISVKTGAHLAAFKAIKILRDRKMLLMVPDARGRVKQGGFKEASEVEILGRPRQFADGAPTIAFESGCATGWYMVIREGDRFVPVYEPGPSREAKESFTTFKERWWAFYAAQVEKLFTGDPRNISLFHFWPRLFGSTASADLSGEEDDADDETTM